MRKQLAKDASERKLIKQYQKLYVPIVELVQTLQDVIPPASVIGDKIELTQIDGEIELTTTLRPRVLVINDGTRKFSLIIEEVS